MNRTPEDAHHGPPRQFHHQTPSGPQAAARSHCKVVVFEFRDHSCPLVFEGSANLRKNGCREQLAAIRDQELARWHGQWIDDTVTAHERD